MPRYEFECSFCKGVTVIMLYANSEHIPTPDQCEHCGEDFLTLIRYDKDIDSQIKALQKDISCLQQRYFDLEGGEELEDERDFKLYI